MRDAVEFRTLVGTRVKVPATLRVRNRLDTVEGGCIGELQTGI
jgi:hypothetical protein